MIQSCTLKGSTVRYFGSTTFSMSGRNYHIISTRTTGRGIYDAVDTVKNDRGETRDYRRNELIDMIEKGGAR